MLGREGQSEPPTVVIRLTVSSSKPSLCVDARYVNLWTKPLPFSLDTLADLLPLVGEGTFLSAIDDKSGYDHILLTVDSRQYFGIEWEGILYCFNTLVFGWSASTFIYHKIGMIATLTLGHWGWSSYNTLMIDI